MQVYSNGDVFMFKKLLLMLTASLIFYGQAVSAENFPNKIQGEKTMKDLSISDYETVKSAINKYLEAGVKADSSVAKPAFYKDAVIYSNENGKISGGSIQSLYDYFDQNPPATELKADISSVDIAGNIAFAKVESENWHGARYTDMFLLVKENNEWKIITKVFHTH